MDFKDIHTCGFIWQRNLNFSIQTPLQLGNKKHNGTGKKNAFTYGSKQGRVENVRAVSGHHNLNLAQTFKTIKLIQQLKQLNGTVSF